MRALKYSGEEWLGDIPENCIAVGVPARVVRHGIRWEEKFQR